MDENFDWTNGIVAIYGDKSQPVGTGFIVSPDGLIVTCAHVLDLAGWPFEDWHAPVQVRFKATSSFADAVVLEDCYRPSHQGDMAILTLETSLPGDVEVLPLWQSGDAAGHTTFMYGYPAGFREGLRGEGQVLGLVPQDGRQVLQLRSTETTHGYSSGPVWDSTYQRVTGMILRGIEADAHGRLAFTTFAVPAEALVELCTELTMTEPADPQAEGDLRVLRPYLELVARQVNHLPLASLDPSGQESDYLTLAQVFVDLDAGLGNLAGDQFGIDSNVLYSAALGHVYHNRRLILLGDPGSGKTTLLRYLALVFAKAVLEPEGRWLDRLHWMEHSRPVEERIGHAWPKDFFEMKSRSESWTSESPIPVYVTLRDFARESFDSDSPLAIWNHFARRLESEGLPTAVEPLEWQASAGNVVLLLDGVDEVPLEQRPAVWKAIASMRSGPFGGNRWLATCRILSFSKDEAPPGVPNQTLQPLGEEQIVAFIAAWFDALADSGRLAHQEAESHTASLTKATSRHGLSPLAQNPMLLTIMALVQTYHGTLPDERAKLYQACVETLLLRWQRHKERSAEGELLPEPLAQLGVKQEDLERLLWEIAWTAHNEVPSREGQADIPESQVIAIALKHLESYTKAEAFLEYTERRAHLLIGRGGVGERVYAFPHRTFQEYLAACHLASGRRFPTQAVSRAEDPALWRETLTLAAGTLVFNRSNRERALDAVKGVMPRLTPEPDDEAGWNRVWMAGEMMAVVGRTAAEKDEVGREILPELRQQLVALLEGGRLAPTARAEAGDALGRIGDPRPGVCTRLPDMISIPAGPFLMGDEKYELELPEFAIGRYPVTNAQFRHFVEDGGYTYKWRDCWTEEGWGYCQDSGWIAPRYWDTASWTIDNHPVVGVSWYEALAYTNWLSQVEDRVFGLPTEAQWERAARHTDGRIYSWGDEWQHDIVNSKEAGAGRTTVVGAFPDGATECGANDMNGNVREWCQSRHRNELRIRYPLPYRPDDGREQLSGGENVLRVLRGGAFVDVHRDVSTAIRFYYIPYNRYIYIGFRVSEHLF